MSKADILENQIATIRGLGINPTYTIMMFTKAQKLGFRELCAFIERETHRYSGYIRTKNKKILESALSC